MNVGDKVVYRGSEMTVTWVGRDLLTAVDEDDRPITAPKTKFKSIRSK
jgi:hypothetical protein